MSKTKPLFLFMVVGLILLACTSVSQFIGIPDPNDPGLNPKDQEDDSIGADMEKWAEINATHTAEALATEPQEDAPNMNEIDLTPEEEINSGKHFYLVEGEGTPLLGGDGTYSGEGFATSDFVNGGVYFNLSEQSPELYTKTSPNTYINENATITVVYTPTGFNLHTDNNGVVWDYAYTLND